MSNPIKNSLEKVPNDWEIEQNNKKEITHALTFVALAVLVTLGALYFDPVSSFLKNHLEFSAIILPSIACGFTLAFALNRLMEDKQKKLTVLALIVFLAIAATWAHFSGLQELKLASLFLGGGVILYFIFNSKKPFPEHFKEGDPTQKFSYGNIWTPDFEEVYFEEQCSAELEDVRSIRKDEIVRLHGRLYIAQSSGQVVQGLEVEKFQTKEALPNLNEVVCCQAKEVYYGRVVQVDRQAGIFYTIEHKKRIFSRSQRRLLENGNYLYPLYLKDEIGAKTTVAMKAVFFMILRSILGACFDLAMIPLYIAYLMIRLPYDLYHSQNKMELLGNRFFEILNVIGDGIESAVTNAFCAVGAFFGCLGMYIEGKIRARPMIFQKFLCKLEQIQNEAPLYRSYWLDPGHGRQYHFDFFSDLRMTADQEIHLKNFGAYILGCCQPHDFLEMTPDGQMVKVSNIQNPGIRNIAIATRNFDLSSQEGWSVAPIRKYT